MADNIINIGAEFDASAIKSGAEVSKQAVGGIKTGFELLGVTINDSISEWLATLPGVGAAFEAAFPIFAIVLLGEQAIQLGEKLAKLHEEAEKLADDQTKFATAVNQAFNSLNDKLLQAGIKADELRGDHLAALKKQLELIDSQSMAELIHSLDTIAKAADVVFADLQSHWYTFGKGSEGAKHALEQFQTQYNSLITQGKDKEATDLLRGTLDSANKVRDALQVIISYRSAQSLNPELIDKAAAAMETLRQAGKSGSEDELKAQEALIDALKAQLSVEKQITDLNRTEKSNARDEEKKHTIIDLTNLAKARGKIEAEVAAATKKQDDEVARGAQNAAQALAEYWRKESEAAKKATDEGLRINQIYTESDIAHTQALEAQARERLDFKLSIGRISQAEHDRLLNTEVDSEYEAARKILKARLAALATNTQEYARTEAELKKLDDKHAADVQHAQQQEYLRTHRFLTDLVNDAKQASQKMADAMKQAIDSMNRDLAQFVVEGKANWAQLAAGAIESILEIVLQYLEGKAAMEIADLLGLGKKTAKNAAEASSSADTAAANALKDVPYPANIGASASVLAIGQGLAVAAGAVHAEGGQWEVPGIQPTILHPQEMVLPAGIASRMRNIVEHGGSFDSDSPRLVFAPTIHALDAQSVDRVLTRHQRIFENRVDKVLRKKGLFTR